MTKTRLLAFGGAMLIIGALCAGPASLAAQFCTSTYCATSTDTLKPGGGWTVRVRMQFTNSDYTHFNVKIGGGKQFELKSTTGVVHFDFFVPPGGTAQYAVQSCKRRFPPLASFCLPWLGRVHPITAEPAPPPSPSGTTPATAIFCQSYATQAVQHTTDSQRRKCGYGGPRWSTDFGAHLKWCTGLNGDQKLPNAETAARLQGLAQCITAQRTLPGIWDSVTGDGVNYTLNLDNQGNGPVGAANPQLDGTIKGTLSADGKQMAFVLTQPKIGITSRGQIALVGNGDSFEGRITKDTDGISRTWKGTRRK